MPHPLPRPRPHPHHHLHSARVSTVNDRELEQLHPSSQVGISINRPGLKFSIGFVSDESLQSTGFHVHSCSDNPTIIDKPAEWTQNYVV